MRLGKSTTKTFEMFCEAFGEHSLRWTVASEWHSSFKASSVKDDEHSGRPNNSKMTENADKIRAQRLPPNDPTDRRCRWN
jgi:hypothetical protein